MFFTGVNSLKFSPYYAQNRLRPERRCKRQTYRREARAEGVVRVVTFKGSRRASVVVPVSPSAESRGASLAAFLTSPACHGALLDAPLYYQVEGAAPYTYKCQAGWQANVLGFKLSPSLTVHVRPDEQAGASEEEGGLLVEVVGTDFTGAGEVALNQLTDLTSTNRVRWRDLSSADAARAGVDAPVGGSLMKVTSDAAVCVSLSLPDWFPVAPAVVEMAGSQAVQVILDDSLPRFIGRLVDAYSWWAGAAGANSSSRVWRSTLRGPGRQYSQVGVSGGASALPRKASSDSEGGHPNNSNSNNNNNNNKTVMMASFDDATPEPQVEAPGPNLGGSAPPVEAPAAKSFSEEAEQAQEAVAAQTKADARAKAQMAKQAQAQAQAHFEAKAQAQAPVEPEPQPPLPSDPRPPSPAASPPPVGSDEDRAKADSVIPGMWDAYYERQGKLAVFKARRTLVLPIREPPEAASGDLPITVEDYLANPERLVRIVYGPGQFTKNTEDTWSIKLVAINILQWSVVPVYTLMMQFSDGRLLAQSGTVGLDPKNRPKMFDDMELTMKLNCITDVVRTRSRIKSAGATCQLEAFAALDIAADLPQLLKFVPGLTQIGNGILEAILAAVEFAARAKLEDDYLKFVKQTKADLAAAEAVSESVNVTAGTGSEQ